MDSILAAAKIKNLLFLAGLSLADIDRKYRLKTGIARNTLRQPHQAGEKAISDALALPPEALWPERYEVGGRRKRPQPRENHSSFQTFSQRRKKSDQLARGI